MISVFGSAIGEEEINIPISLIASAFLCGTNWLDIYTNAIFIPH